MMTNMPTVRPMRNVAWPMGRDAHGRFLPGGPGRPVGERNRMSAQAGRWLLTDFGDHRDELLPRMRRWFLPQYLQLIGRMLPREVDIAEDAAGAGEPALSDLGPAELAALVSAAKAALAQLAAGGEGEAAAPETAAEAAAADTQDGG